MDYIDLVSLLKAFKGKMQGVIVYGRIVSRLPRPNNLFDSVNLEEKGMFVKMQVFAVNLGYYDSYLRQSGITNPDNVYMVNGNLALYIKEVGYKLPDFYSCSGTLRFGSKTGFPYLNMFNYRKTGNDWYISCNDLNDISTEEFTPKTEAYNWLNRSRQSGMIELPDVVKSLPLFYAQPSNVVENKGIDVSKEMNNVQIPTPSAPATYIPANKFVPESRSEIKEMSKLVETLEERAMDSDKAKLKFIKSLKEDYGTNVSVNRYLEYMLKSLSANLKHKPNQMASTGQMLLKGYLSHFKLSSVKYLGTTAGDYLVSIFNEVADAMRHGSHLNADGDAWKLYKLAFGEPEVFYAGICAQIYGIPYDILSDTVELCCQNDISLSSIINNNPYVLQMISALSYNQIENIAVSLGLSSDKTISRYKNIALLNSFLMTEGGNTVYTIDSLKTSRRIGVSLTKRQYEMCMATGSYLNKTLLANVHFYISNENDTRVDVKGFVQSGYNYVQRLTSSELDVAIRDYTESGMGVLFDGKTSYLTSSSMLKKELFVYNYMYDLGEQETGISHEEIDKYIDEYEGVVGFKLEPEQRTAVHLLTKHAGLVSGGAGSGKTTTSNCFVYVLEHIEPKVTFKFATPTGKAAKRLQEVVKRPAKTMSSMFKTFATTETIFDKEDDMELGNDEVYIFDENAMVTIDLLYTCLRRINNSRIYLFGDYQQLPPIGKGLPFKNLLRFMPCVFLNVSKRAAEGSQITAVADDINKHSEYNDWKELTSKKDFFLIPCSEDRINEYTSMIARIYTGQGTQEEIELLKKLIRQGTLPQVSGLTADDIQVITPLSKATYTWGATRLNAVLQPIFNKNKGFNNTYCYQVSENSPYTKFILGDRVIHTEQNMYKMQWYESYKDGIFKKKFGFGICNGEVGKLVAFYPADTCEFYDEDGDKPDDFDYPDGMRDDSDWHGDGAWFAVVEYFDYMSDSIFYIVYRCTENYNIDNGIGRSFGGDDFAKLNLFYAGTTHKMQGSQSGLVIAPLGSVNYKGFITRNMMYTVITRATDLVFCLGSVGNEMNSQLSRARREISEDGVLTIGELLHTDY